VLLVSNGSIVMAFQNCREPAVPELQRSSWRRFVEALHNSVAAQNSSGRLVSIFLWKAATSVVAGNGSKGGGAPLTRAERVKMAMWEEEEQFIFYFYFIYLVGLLLTPLESSAGGIFWALG
jgi:hypothetical protein